MVALLAVNVIPDPVPMAAAIGITLDCWRHTELETAHAGSRTLTDVAMAKLSIATTRALRSYITTDGIDWDGIGGVLLDPERQLPDGRTVTQLVGQESWPLVQESVADKLDNWTHVESVAGPEATLRLASAMGLLDLYDTLVGKRLVARIFRRRDSSCRATVSRAGAPR